MFFFLKFLLWRNGHERRVHTRIMKTDMMPAATGTQDEKVTPFTY